MNGVQATFGPKSRCRSSDVYFFHRAAPRPRDFARSSFSSRPSSRFRRIPRISISNRPAAYNRARSRDRGPFLPNVRRNGGTLRNRTSKINVRRFSRFYVTRRMSSGRRGRLDPNNRERVMQGEKIARQLELCSDAGARAPTPRPPSVSGAVLLLMAVISDLLVATFLRRNVIISYTGVINSCLDSHWESISLDGSSPSNPCNLLVRFSTKTTLLPFSRFEQAFFICTVNSALFQMYRCGSIARPSQLNASTIGTWLISTTKISSRKLRFFPTKCTNLGLNSKSQTYTWIKT